MRYAKKKKNYIIVVLISALSVLWFYFFVYAPTRTTNRIKRVQTISVVIEKLYYLYNKEKHFPELNKFREKIPAKQKEFCIKNSIKIYYSKEGIKFKDDRRWYLIIAGNDGYMKVRILKKNNNNVLDREFVSELKSLPVNIEKYLIIP